MFRSAADSGPLVERRVEELQALLNSVEVDGVELDRAKANALLRALFGVAIVHREAGTVKLKWLHGGESELVFAFPEEA